MVGTNDNPVQIDEARFAGRQKYNRGRILNGDNAPLFEDSDAEQGNDRNHGRGIDGPWAFGLNQGSGCRYFCVERRNRNSLIPIIERECEKGSVIHSDVWSVCGNLKCLRLSPSDSEPSTTLCGSSDRSTHTGH
ncbi:Hypothetical predicted protein [Octopus vulgaris]|uniref:Uncharacterized protein n=1 Tax=Octopus vulgaris TaxID=6645 RepID=A0AA36FAX4_OCTVU|nr:Hypothetical predicted protein [Octopus vulgaris]